MIAIVLAACGNATTSYETLDELRAAIDPNGPELCENWSVGYTEEYAAEVGVPALTVAGCTSDEPTGIGIVSLHTDREQAMYFHDAWAGASPDSTSAYLLGENWAIGLGIQADELPRIVEPEAVQRRVGGDLIVREPGDVDLTDEEVVSVITAHQRAGSSAHHGIVEDGPEKLLAEFRLWMRPNEGIGAVFAGLSDDEILSEAWAICDSLARGWTLEALEDEWWRKWPTDVDRRVSYAYLGYLADVQLCDNPRLRDDERPATAAAPPTTTASTTTTLPSTNTTLPAVSEGCLNNERRPLKWTAQCFIEAWEVDDYEAALRHGDNHAAEALFSRRPGGKVALASCYPERNEAAFWITNWTCQFSTSDATIEVYVYVDDDVPSEVEAVGFDGVVPDQPSPSEAALGRFSSSQAACQAFAAEVGNDPPNPARYADVVVVTDLGDDRVLIEDGLGYQLIVDMSGDATTFYSSEGPDAVLPFDLTFGCPADLYLGSWH